MLQMINKSPYGNDSFELAVRFALDGDPILLIEDGVYAGRGKGSSSEKLKTALDKHQVYAIDADVEARGIQDLDERVKVIDYAGFVDLVEEHKVNSWL